MNYLLLLNDDVHLWYDKLVSYLNLKNYLLDTTINIIDRRMNKFET